jgi:16S rRNA (cytosine967-C5)-methyltransferase
VDGAALRVEGPRGITTSALYQAGRIEGMDRSSQLCAEKALPWPGARVWDAAAGRGGKTLVLARALDGRGSLQATDTDPEKLATLKTRLRRAGLADVVRIQPWDGQAVPQFGPEVRGGFDIVLVDTPCSSSGTWRRNPDAKLRVLPSALDRYRPVQEQLVALALSALRPGGKVVYVTCSFAVEENEDVVEASGATVVEQGRFAPPEVDGDTMFYAVLTPP